AFHEAIARASGNRLCQMIFSMIHKALLRSITQNSRRAPRRETLRYHGLVYKAVFSRNPEQARKQMADHIREAKALLLGPREGCADTREAGTMRISARERRPR